MENYLQAGRQAADPAGALINKGSIPLTWNLLENLNPVDLEAIHIFRSYGRIIDACRTPE